MGDPAGKKQGHRGCLQVGGARGNKFRTCQVPAMINGHDDHDQPPKEIDGFYPIHKKQYKMSMLSLAARAGIFILNESFFMRFSNKFNQMVTNACGR